MFPQPQTGMAQCVRPPRPNNRRLLTTEQEYMFSTPPSRGIPTRVSLVSSYSVRFTRVCIQH